MNENNHEEINVESLLQNTEKSDDKKPVIDPEGIRGKVEEARNELVKSYMLANFADKIQPLNRFLEELETEIIKHALLISEENQKKAAFLLGMNPPTLCEKMKRLNIKLDRSYQKNSAALKRSFEEIGKLISAIDSE